MTQAGALSRRVNAEQAQVASVATKFDINATGKACGIIGNEKFTFGHVGANAFGIDAVAIDKGKFDTESGVDQADEGFRVRNGGHAEVQGIILESFVGGILHRSNGILTCSWMNSSLGEFDL